jgi:ubiquinone/menaquinone biosynthesis C-methylase UbiE
VTKVVGIDVDANAENNLCLDEFHLIKDDVWSVDSNSIDLIVCDNVLEHIEKPDCFFSEVKRVLKNGGFLCVRTPNRWNYVALLATLIPNKYHGRVVSVAQKGRKNEDVFPTVYRCNSVRKLKKMMRQVGFECTVYGYESEPSYFSFSKIFYFMGVLHQRFAPSCFKAAIFGFGRMKKD